MNKSQVRLPVQSNPLPRNFFVHVNDSWGEPYTSKYRVSDVIGEPIEEKLATTMGRFYAECG